MKQSEHPKTETLAAYADAPDDKEYGQLKLHLAQCPQCRKTVGKYSMLLNNLQKFVPAAVTSLSENEVLEVAQYISGELDEQHADNIGKKIQQNKNLMKAALHYSLHSAAMQNELKTDVSASAGLKPANNQISNQISKPGVGAALSEKLKSIWQEFWHWRAPVWITTPVAAVLVLMLMTNLSIQKTNMIAVYQDEPIMHFQKTTQIIPGIGFFNAARESEMKYGKVLASTDKQGRVTMQWPPVKNAEKYSVSIYRIEENEKIVASQQETNSTTVLFPDFKPEYRRNYFWEIRGHTTDGQMFHTDGGFVVTRE